MKYVKTKHLRDEYDKTIVHPDIITNTNSMKAFKYVHDVLKCYN